MLKISRRHQFFGRLGVSILFHGAAGGGAGVVMKMNINGLNSPLLWKQFAEFSAKGEE